MILSQLVLLLGQLMGLVRLLASDARLQTSRTALDRQTQVIETNVVAGSEDRRRLFG